ncbi:Kinetochore protein nuf2 [Schizosaccharomyces pombe]
MARKHTFPSLKRAEILECIDGLGIPFTAKELDQPTSKAVIPLYEEFLDLFMGLTRQNLEEKVNSLQDSVENFEIIHESLRFTVFYQILSQFMQNICFHDFTIQDLLKPDRNRLQLILSAVINFAKLREERLQQFDDDIQKRESLLETYTLLDAQRKDLEEKVLLSQDRKLESEAIIKQNEERNEEMFQSLIEDKRLCSQVRTEYDRIRMEASELKIRYHNVDSLMASTLEEIEKLQSSIVHSPEKLKGKIADTSLRIQNDRSQQVELDKKSKILHTKLNSLQLIEGDLNACLKVLEECLVELDKLEHATVLLSTNQELCDQIEINKKKLEFRKEQLLKQLSNAQEKLEHEQHSRNQKLEAAKQRMDNIREEYKVITQERNKKIQEAEKKNAMIEMTEQKIAGMREELESQISSITMEFEKLKSHVELYIAELLRNLRSSNS